MIGWYEWFLFAMVMVWLVATPRDRRAATIVCTATVASALIVWLVTSRIEAPWKLLVPSVVEDLTIACLLTWARNRTGYWQVGCLVFAWLAHRLCYVDVLMGSDLIYSRYETVLALVAVAQLAGFYETLSHIFRELVADGKIFGRALRRGALRARGLCRPLFRRSTLPKL